MSCCALALGLAYPGTGASAEEPLDPKYKITRQVAAIPPRLMGWWAGDADALDSLGRNSARPHGEVTYVPGMVGQAFHLNGKNSYLKVLTTDLNPGVGAGFTLDLWIKAEDLSQLQPLAGWSGTNAPGVSLWLQPADANGRAKFGTDLRDSKGASHRLLSEQAVIGVGQWHHIALEYSKVNGVVRLFCDGQVQAEKTLGVLDPKTDLDFYIGKHAYINAGNTTFKGAIDEVTLTARAADPAEVQDVFRAGSAGKQLVSEKDPMLSLEQRKEGLDKRLASFAAKHNGQAATCAIYVDGSDYVHIQGDKLWLVHDGWQLPGGSAPNLRPTRINGTEWIPGWNEKTSERTTLATPLPKDGEPLLCIDILNNGDIPARSDAPFNVRITQEPTAANGYEAILYIDDLNVGGAHWFAFCVSWDEQKKADG